MVPCAPRYPPLLVEAIGALDDGRMPIAELCRRLGAYAAELGFIRPSYVHVRRYVIALRAVAQAADRRRQEIRAVASDAAARALAGLVPDPVGVAARIREANQHYELVALSHKPRGPD